MKLVEKHIIKSTHPSYQTLDQICFLSKNLYNIALYTIRQNFFSYEKTVGEGKQPKNKRYLNYNDINNEFVKSKQIDYYKLPAKVAQQTLKLVDKNFMSFFSLLKKKDIKKKSIPRYLDKSKGRFVTTFTIQAISKKYLKQEIIKLSGVDDFELHTKVNAKEIQQVRIIPKGHHMVVEVVYNYQEKDLKEDNNRYASIDLGLNNLATVASNVTTPLIINGRPLKSINHFYNRKRADYQSRLKGDKKTSNRIKQLTFKRNNKVNDYLHKSSKILVNHLVSNQINTLVIGHNQEWKQEINIGKVNNQNFVNIPHSTFIHMLNYKCQMKGINVIEIEESYTSKCSFLDNEEICKHDEYKGRRIERGLFKSFTGKLVNADVNGAYNILKKAVGKFNYDPIQVCSTPVVVSTRN